jgi:hypothetical protein
LNALKNQWRKHYALTQYFLLKVFEKVWILPEVLLLSCTTEALKEKTELHNIAEVKGLISQRPKN